MVSEGIIETRHAWASMRIKQNSNLFPRFNVSVMAPFFFFPAFFLTLKDIEWHLCLIPAFTLNGDGSHFVETCFPSQGEANLLKV